MHALVTRSAMILASLCLASSQSPAGDLNPPPGAIGGTMKPLDAIEPRTCVNDLPGSPGAVHVIDAPGNYYLVADIAGEQGKHGVHIITDGAVRLDLNGFSLLGSPASLDAIRVQGGLSFECVEVAHEGLKMQGVIGGWGGDGVHVEGDPDRPVIVSLQGLNITDCLGDGVEVTSKKLFVGGLSISDCAGDGMRATADEIHCDEHGRVKVQFCAGDGITLLDVRQCTMANVSVSDNGGAGVSMSTPLAAGDFRWRLRTVDSVANELQGIVVLCSVGSSAIDIDECCATGNGGNGIDLRVDPSASCWVRVSQSSASDNGGGASSPDPGHGVVVAELAGPMRGGGAGGAGGGGDGGRVSVEFDSTAASGNLGDGLRVIQSFNQMNQAIIRNIRSATNGGNGVTADLVSGELTIDGSSSAANTGHGYAVQYRETDFNFVCRNSSATGNGADGFNADSVAGLCGPIHATGCVATGNTGAGFNLLCTSGGAIRRCEARGNAGSGFGVAGTGHTIVGNVAGGNAGGDYSVAVPGNLLGPIVTETNISTNQSPHANYQSP